MLLSVGLLCVNNEAMQLCSDHEDCASDWVKSDQCCVRNICRDCNVLRNVNVNITGVNLTHFEQSKTNETTDQCFDWPIFNKTICKNCEL